MLVVSVNRCVAVTILAALVAMISPLTITCAEPRVKNDAIRGANSPSFTLKVAPSLEPERSRYRNETVSALNDVVAWFAEAGYSTNPEDLIEKAVVFDDLTTAKQTLAEVCGVAQAEIPGTFGGTVKNTTLYLVSRELYRASWDKLYSDWPWTAQTYSGLIAHELAHRAHEYVAVSRFGTADAMGPTWFFEGLAVACAGQFRDTSTPMTREEIEQHVGYGESPPVSYPLYGRLAASLAHHSGWRNVIARASEPGFPVLEFNPAQAG